MIFQQLSNLLHFTWAGRVVDQDTAVAFRPRASAFPSRLETHYSQIFIKIYTTGKTVSNEARVGKAKGSSVNLTQCFQSHEKTTFGFMIHVCHHPLGVRGEGPEAFEGRYLLCPSSDYSDAIDPCLLISPLCFDLSVKINPFVT